jgi:hypothetical protein
LKVFGCTAYAHVDNGKLEPRAIKCLFLGYGSRVKGYMLWNPETRKTFISRSVVFNESMMFYDSLTSEHIPDNFDKELQYINVQVEHEDDAEGVQVQHHVHDDTGVQVEPPVDDQENDVVDNESHDDVQHLPPILQLDEDLPIATCNSKRGCGRPHRLIEECNMIYYALSCAEQVDSSYEPATYFEAIACSDREKWIATM